MKKMNTAMMSAVVVALSMGVGAASAQVSEEVLRSISTPDKVETSIGTLEFLDGAALPETAQKAYDYLDTCLLYTSPSPRDHG